MTSATSTGRPTAWWRRMSTTAGRAFDRAVEEVVDHRALVALRMAVGPLVVLHLWPYLTLAGEGITYRDRVWVPFVSWYPEVGATAYVGLLALGVAAALATSVGLFTRTASALTATVVVYHLFLSQIHYHHNRMFLAILLIGVALLPLGASVSVDAWLRRRRGLPARRPLARRWPLTLLRFEIALVYIASGTSKLLDPDWFGGTVLRLRTAAGLGGRDLFPDGLSELVVSPAFHAVFAPVVVLTELAIGVGLLVPTTRWLAVWLAVAFHVAIEVTADVQVFSLAALIALAIWVTPSPERRVIRYPETADGRRQARLIHGLDWTARFDVGTSPEPDPPAQVDVAVLLPATFFWVYPVAVALRIREVGRRRRRGVEDRLPAG